MHETPTNSRQQALAGLHRATATITELFDAKDGLHAALGALAAAAGGPDPLRAAVEVGELVSRVADAVRVVQAAATAAAEFEPQKTIAGYLDSRVVLVFPRAVGSVPSGASPGALLPSPATSVQVRLAE